MPARCRSDRMRHKRTIIHKQGAKRSPMEVDIRNIRAALRRSVTKPKSTDRAPYLRLAVGYALHDCTLPSKTTKRRLPKRAISSRAPASTDPSRLIHCQRIRCASAPSVHDTGPKAGNAKPRNRSIESDGSGARLLAIVKARFSSGFVIWEPLRVRAHIVDKRSRPVRVWDSARAKHCSQPGPDVRFDTRTAKRTADQTRARPKSRATARQG